MKIVTLTPGLFHLGREDDDDDELLDALADTRFARVTGIERRPLSGVESFAAANHAVLLSVPADLDGRVDQALQQLASLVFGPGNFAQMQRAFSQQAQLLTHPIDNLAAETDDVEAAAQRLDFVRSVLHLCWLHRRFPMLWTGGPA